MAVLSLEKRPFPSPCLVVGIKEEDICYGSQNKVATCTVSCLRERLKGRTTVQPVTPEQQYYLCISLQCNPRLLIKSPVMLLLPSSFNVTKRLEQRERERDGVYTKDTTLTYSEFKCNFSYVSLGSTCSQQLLPNKVRCGSS